MPAYKFANGFGYLISFIIGILWLTIFGLMYAVVLYPVTILLRTIGWSSAAKSFKKKLFYVTAAVVLLLGFIIFVSILSQVGDVETVKTLTILWAIYSLIEFVSYGLLIKYSKIFVASLSSIIGILVMVNFITTPVTQVQEIYTFAVIAVPFLIISSLASFIGFFRLKRPESVMEPTTAMPAPIAPQEAYIICPNCGRQIPSGSRFCPFCGFKIEQ